MIVYQLQKSTQDFLDYNPTEYLFAVGITCCEVQISWEMSGKKKLLKSRIVRQICAIYQYNCAKDGKGLKIHTKEADTI